MATNAGIRKRAAARDTSEAPSAVSTSQHQNDKKDKNTSSTPIWSITRTLVILLIPRIIAAIISPILDCDETFNYWEPLHWVLNGRGLQTWEYSPEYMLRSYLYLVIHAFPLKLANLLHIPGPIQFYLLRVVIATVTASCEAFFINSIARRFGGRTQRYSIIVHAVSTGMFHSTVALLPQTFTMCFLLMTWASWMNGNDMWAIFFTGCSALLGWPFAGLLALPLTIDIVYRYIVYYIGQKQIGTAIMGTIRGPLKWAIVSAAFCLIPSVLIDYHYYKKWVIAVVQIAVYNGRTTDAEHGPMVFGVEPWHFYPINLFLNFNFAFILAVAAPFIIALTYGITNKKANSSSMLWSWAKYTSPLWLWLAIFMRMAHKEERFLFVVYPLLCLSAAIALSTLHTGVRSLTRSSTSVLMLIGTIIIPYIIISLSRTSALVVYYGAPVRVYDHVHTIAMNHIRHGDDLSGNNTSICVGKEWYRFPSHFFLPSPYHLEFIKSDFTGLLPAHFEASTSDVLASSVIPRAPMNDRNMEVTSRYVAVDQCAYIIDLNLGQPHEHEPYYQPSSSSSINEWTVVGNWPFLDAPSSHRLARAFYIPYVTPSHLLKYRSYQLLKRTPRAPNGDAAEQQA